MRILITGATGMVGSELFRQALSDPGVTSITTLTRKPLAIEHPKLTSVIHHDYLDYSAVQPVLAGCDACIWCLGVSQLEVSKEVYHQITYDYTIAGAEALLKANPKAAFIFVSGDGADQHGKARTLFGKVKGKAERDLQKLPFGKLMIARPAGIKPVRNDRKVPFLYRLFYFLYPVARLLTPSKVITSVELAHALLMLARINDSKIVWDNRELKELSKKIADSVDKRQKLKDTTSYKRLFTFSF